MAIGTMIELPAMAQAETKPIFADYNGACGAGYRVVDWIEIGPGNAYLTWDSSTGKNCVVTVRHTPAVVPVEMSAWIEGAGNPNVDHGYYTTYAGPRFVNGRGTCISFGGSVEGKYAEKRNVHCG
ncbi:spore-associated protein A [Streptomyces olivoreticuli]